MRFFFNTHDKLRIDDELGREFAGPADAVVFAKHLAADLRCLETAVRPALAIEVIAENAGCIHRELFFDQPTRLPRPAGFAASPANSPPAS